MPRIPQIMLDSVPQGELSVPKASPSEFGIGKGLASLGEGLTKGADAVYKNQELQEKSQVAVQLSQAKSDYTTYLFDMLKSGNVDVDKFQQNLQNHLGQIGENLSTPAAQSLFEENSAKLSSEFQTRAHLEASALAGEQAHNNFVDMLNNYSSQAELSPADFHSNIAAVHSFLDSNTQDLGEKNVLKLKEKSQQQIALSAAGGMIDMDATQAEKDIKSGMFNDYLPGTKVAQLVKQSQVRQRLNETEAKRQEVAARDDMKQQHMEIGNKILSDIYNGKASIPQILKSGLPPSGENSQESYIRILHSELDRKNKSDPQVFNSLFERVHLDNGDPNKIYDENQVNRMMSHGEISVADGIKIRKEIQQMRLPTGELESDAKKQIFQLAKSKLVQANPMLGIKDNQGQLQLSRFTNWALSEFDRQRKAGIPSQELLSPDGKYYLGNGIRQFYRTPKQIMDDLTQSLHGSPLSVPDYTTPSMIGADPSAPPPPPSVKPTPLSFDEWRAQKNKARK